MAETTCYTGKSTSTETMLEKVVVRQTMHPTRQTQGPAHMHTFLVEGMSASDDNINEPNDALRANTLFCTRGSWPSSGYTLPRDNIGLQRRRR